MGTGGAAHSARTAKALRAAGNRSIDGGRRRMGMLFPRCSREHAKATRGQSSPQRPKRRLSPPGGIPDFPVGDRLRNGSNRIGDDR